MHQSARQAAIMKTLGSQGVCTVIDLAEQLSVSGETIRRDIKVMANKGLVERVHGGVLLPDLFREPDFQKRLNRNADAKSAIAATVALSVQNGDSLMLDTGSSTVYVARALRHHKDLMVVTNCTEIAATLAGGSGNKIYLAGGEFRGDDGAVFGTAAIDFVEQFRVRTAILSIGAINLDDGMMDFHLSEAAFSQAVIRRANKVMVVADSSKFGLQAPIKVCGFSDIDVLVSEAPPPKGYRQRLTAANVQSIAA